MAEKDGIRKPLGAPRKEGEHDAAEDRMEDWYREELVEFEEGEVVRGRVVQVGTSEVLIDVGYKSEGSIPIEEFQRGGILPKVGDEIEVYLEAKEDNEGLIVLSKDKADKIKVWDVVRSEEHTSELQSHSDLVCRLLLEKKNCSIANLLITD